MVFKHRKTNKPALMVVDSIDGWTNPEDANLIRIEKPTDLPDFPWSKHFNMPPEIVDNPSQGKTGIIAYLRAFLEKPRDVIWLFFMPSGFPGEEIVQGE
jgi:hypothetical protein